MTWCFICHHTTALAVPAVVLQMGLAWLPLASSGVGLMTGLPLAGCTDSLKTPPMLCTTTHLLALGLFELLLVHLHVEIV